MIQNCKLCALGSPANIKLTIFKKHNFVNMGGVGCEDKCSIESEELEV